jgi:hypothetical protein
LLQVQLSSNQSLMQIPKHALAISTAVLSFGVLCGCASDTNAQTKARVEMRLKIAELDGQKRVEAVTPRAATKGSPVVDAAALEKARRQLEQKTAELEASQQKQVQPRQ